MNRIRITEYGFEVTDHDMSFQFWEDLLYSEYLDSVYMGHANHKMTGKIQPRLCFRHKNKSVICIGIPDWLNAVLKAMAETEQEFCVENLRKAIKFYAVVKTV